MGYVINSLLRLLQFGLSILALGLAATLPTQQVLGGSPTRVNFTIFTTALALLTLLYLLPTTLIPSLRARAYHPLLALILDVVNLIFFLSAAIAMAAQLGVHSCGNRAYLRSNGITNGGGYWDMEKRCREAQALTAFLWFSLPLWAAGAVVAAREYFSGGWGGGGTRSVGRSVRGMTQV